MLHNKSDYGQMTEKTAASGGALRHVEPQKTSEVRRRLLRGGVGATPVLMTLVSRPALGQQACTSMSGFVSMPTSQHGQPKTCLGRTPGYWKQPQHFDDWRPPFYPVTMTGPGGHKATKFSQFFTPSPYPSATTCLQVLDMGGGPPNDVARHIVATALNIQRGWVPVLTLAQIQGVWKDYMNTGGGTQGFFEPTAGVKWFHDEIVDYLKSTMPL